MTKFPLSEAQIYHFRQEGYLVVPGMFDADDLAKVNKTIQDVTDESLASDDYEQVLELEPETSDDGPVLRRIKNPFELHENFRRVATNDRLLDGIETLIGPDITLQHSKLNAKLARVGSVVEWHQDLTYFPHTNDSLVTTLIYLDDATEQNGCLQVLPRHHTHYFSHQLPDGQFAGMITEQIDDGRYGRPIALEATAGSVIFMHCLTPHCSLPNRSENNRRTLIFEYRAADAFPICSQDSVVNGEKFITHLLRGKRSDLVRFGGPAPRIPRLSGTAKSLYDRQTQAKASLSMTKQNSKGDYS